VQEPASERLGRGAVGVAAIPDVQHIPGLDTVVVRDALQAERARLEGAQRFRGVDGVEIASELQGSELLLRSVVGEDDLGDPGVAEKLNRPDDR